MNPIRKTAGLCLLVLLLLGAAGCSLNDTNKNEGTGSAGNIRPTLSYEVNGSTLKESGSLRPGDLYREGMTVRDLLSESGVAHFSNDSRSIAGVSKITLVPGLSWRLKLNGDPLKADDWDRKLAPGDHLTLSAEPENSGSTGQYVLLSVSGGRERQELSHSYVYPYAEEMTVRSLLLHSGEVNLDENGRGIGEVEGYMPTGEWAWKLKVNGKLLLAGGIDMKLMPQDEVEIALLER
ncbi:hypothetical protein F4V43_03235 [Paenibacillus spiritus]|uniref:Lipoprotein n=1 Tax=Paenibacillus spiritus TaxID=2496557 RepID=A0A5J5GHF7_9BACL|nr:hypothetical protein [Paenibacillus spiritus]KAA9007517.1 hypothetical protein F4V43_03235 [Paenibacillus spiritus]